MNTLVCNDGRSAVLTAKCHCHCAAGGGGGVEVHVRGGEVSTHGGYGLWGAGVGDVVDGTVPALGGGGDHAVGEGASDDELDVVQSDEADVRRQTLERVCEGAGWKTYIALVNWVWPVCKFTDSM